MTSDTIALASVKLQSVEPLVSAPTIDGLSICIPVYNEEAALAETLERCLALEGELRRAGVPAVEVIAVDDGSTDRSAEIAARYPAVRLIRHPRNRGYGSALKTGFETARYQMVGFLDADATYPPEQFPALCEAIRQGADLVIGSRLAGAETQMPWIRRLGNTLFAWILTLLGRTTVTDSASGMRVFRRHVLPLLSPLPNGLNLTPVMSTRALHEGIRVVEVAIPYAERVGDSKLSVTRDGVRFLGTIVATVLAYNPVRVFGVLGLCGIGIAVVIAATLLGLRLSGQTTLGPGGVFAVFVAVVSGVAGVSLFALGATFNYLVSLFYQRPIRQGLFKRPFFTRPIEQLFLPAGLLSGGLGLVLSVTSLVLSTRGWPIERLWLYLSGGAMLFLVALQLLTWWVMASVLRQLSQSTTMEHRHAGTD
jgi:hypothetical protein